MSPAVIANTLESRCVMRCPVDVAGKPVRRREGFDTTYCQDATFIRCVELLHDEKTPPPISYSRTLHEEEWEHILKTLEDRSKQIYAPAGIPGYDWVFVRGSKLVNLAQPVARLTSVKFRYTQPMPRMETGDGTLYTAGYWSQDITYTLLRLRITRYDWTKLLKAYQHAEGQTPQLAQ